MMMMMMMMMMTTTRRTMSPKSPVRSARARRTRVMDAPMAAPESLPGKLRMEQAWPSIPGTRALKKLGADRVTTRKKILHEDPITGHLSEKKKVDSWAINPNKCSHMFVNSVFSIPSTIYFITYSVRYRNYHNKTIKRKSIVASFSKWSTNSVNCRLSRSMLDCWAHIPWHLSRLWTLETRYVTSENGTKMQVDWQNWPRLTSTWNFGHKLYKLKLGCCL